MTYQIADQRNPYMGLDNKICKNPTYWCRLHQVWLSEEDVMRKKCRCKDDFDMIGTHRCGNLERNDMGMNDVEKTIDCHYCEYAACQDKNSSCDCYVEDFGYFSHHVEDSKKEAENCLWFNFCDVFPKT